MFASYVTRRPVTAAAVAVGLALAGCSAADPHSTSVSSSPTSPSTTTASVDAADDSPGHGFIEGATETTEPQLRLAVVAPDGSTSGIDLLTGDPVDLPDVPTPTTVTSDGRYLFAASATGMTVLDSGVWTVPHGDHSHHYKAAPRLVGQLPGSAAMQASSASSLVAVSNSDTGTAVVLDGPALGQGSITPVAQLAGTPADGPLVPLGSHLVQTTSSAPGSPADTVQIVNPTGSPVPGAHIACPGAAHTITSRVGVVVGCSDGAVLAAGGPDSGAAPTLTHIAYPAPVSVSERARDFRARKDRPTVAAIAGERGAWILDTRERTWTLLPTTSPLIVVAAVDDKDRSVVAVDREGRILVLNAETGAITGRSEPLLAATMADPALQDAVTIEVDSARAYVNDPAGRRILEIDHGDRGRISRQFPTVDVPMFLAEVG